jgi:hypothetical protein
VFATLNDTYQGYFFRSERFLSQLVRNHGAAAANVEAGKASKFIFHFKNSFFVRSNCKFSFSCNLLMFHKIA